MMKEHELFAGGHRLAATTWGDVGNGQPTIVMMHGGLDCITTWKDLPQVLAEASGWPVLAYDRGAVPEVVAHGETGFAVHTYEELRESLKLLPGLNPQRCRDRVAQRFSRDTMVAAYVKLYDEMGRGL